MRALVTGASGFLGHELTRQLRDAGNDVIAAVGPPQNELERRRIRDLERHARVVPCDLRRERPLPEVAMDWDTLFHLAAYVRTEEDSLDVHINDAGTMRLLRQLSTTNKRVVYTSTLAVADNAPRGWITPETVCMPRTAYGRTKLAAEAIVRQQCQARSAAYTIIRLPTIYGAGYRSGGMFDVFPRRLAAGDPLARLAWPGRMALLSVEDCAKVVHRAAVHEDTKGQTFLASSNENPETWEIAAQIAAATGVSYRRLSLPEPCAALMRRLFGPWWQAPGLPHRVQISTWRAYLLVNGLYCDGTELARLLGVTFSNWRQGFVRMYAEDLRHSARAPRSGR